MTLLCVFVPSTNGAIGLRKRSWLRDGTFCHSKGTPKTFICRSTVGDSTARLNELPPFKLEVMAILNSVSCSDDASTRLASTCHWDPDPDVSSHDLFQLHFNCTGRPSEDGLLRERLP